MGNVLYKTSVVLLFIILLPLYILIGVGIVLFSNFPILFLQKRIGKDGKMFIMYKFRTMVHNADTTKKKYQKLNESQGPVFKIRNDPRFTSVGRFLSHTGFDELPQLINVLRGEMAYIGPRPLPIAEAKKLTFWMKEREKILPGIISPAILTGTYHKDFIAWMKSDVAYARNKHAWGDVILFFHFVSFVSKMLVREIFGNVDK